MDIETMDAQYRQVQVQSQQLTGTLQTLAGKLQAAVQAGDPNAREWLLDLREIALSVQGEEQQISALVTAMHQFAAGSLQAAAVPGTPYPGQPSYTPPPLTPASYAPQPYQAGQPYQAQPYQAQPYQPAQAAQAPGGAGGTLSRLLGSGIGRAIATGAGFGIGDDVVNNIFERL